MCNCFTSFSDPGEGPSSGTRRRHSRWCAFNGDSSLEYSLVSSDLHTRMQQWIVAFVRGIAQVILARLSSCRAILTETTKSQLTGNVSSTFWILPAQGLFLRRASSLPQLARDTARFTRGATCCTDGGRNLAWKSGPPSRQISPHRCRGGMWD